MTLQDYVDEIKLELSGGLLNLEIPDETIATIVKKSLREINRYIDETKIITVPFAPCIDLKDFNYNSIVAVFRASAYSGDTSGEGLNGSFSDPMYMQQWMIFSNGGSMYSLQDYLLNYMAYNTLLQLRNTTSTDLAFREDRQAKKLYINTYDRPPTITIEYIPTFQDVSEIVTDYWIDILQRLSVAQTKIILGRIRSRFKQSNALWTQDGDELLQEGNNELTNLRETLRVNDQITLTLD